MKTLTNYKGIIWDMDGTLLDTLGDIQGALNETLAVYGLPAVTAEQTLSYIGHGARYLCQCASKLDGDELTRFHNDYRAHSLNRQDAKTHPYPGVPEIIRELNARNIKNGIYTNKPMAWCLKLAENFYGKGSFDIAIGTDERQILKPNPQGIFDICKHWNVSVDDVIMIGDSDVDYLTAVNGKCRAVCVSWGFRSENVLRKAGAQTIAANVAQLRQILGLSIDA